MLEVFRLFIQANLSVLSPDLPQNQTNSESIGINFCHLMFAIYYMKNMRRVTREATFAYAKVRAGLKTSVV